MRYVQYLGPSDTFDASNLLGKPAVFHTPTNNAVPSDMRGNVIQVTNDHFEELRTYPRHAFVEVDEAQAKELTARQERARANREGLAALQAQHDVTSIAAPTVEAQIAAVPVAPEIAPAAPRPASEIKAETKAESAAIKEASTAKEK